MHDLAEHRHNHHVLTPSPTPTVATTKKRPMSSSSPSTPDLDPKVLGSLRVKFREVQALLEQNRLLIAQVDLNHQSMLLDNLAKNVTLIQEINRNIAKVTEIYAEMAVKCPDQFGRSGNAKK